jgi:hypothetical protein
MVSMRARSEVQFVENGKARPVVALGEFDSRTKYLPVSNDYAPQASFSRSGKRQPRFRHNTDSDGKIRSLGIVLDENGQLPKRLYVFENGRIQAVYSPRYSRHGSRWIRNGARVTLFGPRGTPIANLNIDAVDASKVRTAEIGRARVTADAIGRLAGRLLLPTPAYAEDLAGDCWKEFLSVLGTEASTIGAAAGTALAAAECRKTGSKAACVTALATLGLTITQIVALIENFDKLIDCELLSWIKLTNSTGGGAWMEPKTRPAAPIDNTGVYQTVEEFIQNAESSCSADGTYCYYFEE